MIYDMVVPLQAACFLRFGLLSSLLMSAATALLAETTSSDWFARPWQSDDGLPNNTVAGLAQTADGYLWLGTPSGLARFDGIRFEDFSPTNFVAPPNRRTLARLLGRDGALWLALARGAVVRLDGHATRAFTEGLPSGNPNGLAEDAEGSLWIAYRLGAVCRIKGGQVSTMTEQDGLPAGIDICALTSDNKGRIWFAKDGHFGVIRDGVFQTLRRFDTVAARLAAARSGGVWLCSGFASGFKLFKIEESGKMEDFGEFHPERARTTATALLEDHDGAVWIGTSFNGLFRHDDAGFQSIQTTHEEVWSLTEDREGNIWV